MANWSSGYVVDVEYTNGFYRELTPLHLNFQLLLHGVESIDLSRNDLTYCELGCGQGFTTNLLAAANPHIQFYATDFNPAHIVSARKLAHQAKLKNTHFFDNSFAEFLEQDDLPDFDFITLHGIYSWIEPEHRQTIVQFIRRKLKPGGVVYISYNCMPGWASMMPLRRIMTEYAAYQGPSKTFQSRVSTSIEFAERFNALNTRYFDNHPKLTHRVNTLKTQNKHYVYHEYFNTSSEPYFFMDLVKEISEAKLTWVGSAAALDTVDRLHLTQEQSEFLAEIDDLILHQTVRDHIVDQQFRRDVFVKGPVKLSQPALDKAWLDTCFTLSMKGSEVPKDIQGTRHVVKLQESLRAPLIAALEGEARPLREILKDPSLKDIPLSRIQKAITYFVGMGSCYPCLPAQGFAERKSCTDSFNEAVTQYSLTERKFSYLASPVSGSGISVPRLDQMIWLALHTKEKDPAQFVADALTKAGQGVVKDGKPLVKEDENLAEMRKRFAAFEQGTLDVWNFLGLGTTPAPTKAKQHLKA